MIKVALLLTSLCLLPLSYAQVSEDQRLAINEDYLQNVYPIFKSKCFDCHTQYTQYPWYYKIPGIKQWIDYDVKDGRKHMEMSHRFPFNDMTTMEHELKEIEEVIKSGEMPPFFYRLMHPSSKISDEDAAKIETWIRRSLTFIQR